MNCKIIRSIIPIILFSLLNACNNSSETTASDIKERITEYHTEKVDCGFKDQTTDSTFYLDSLKINLSYKLYCEGDYDVRDTLRDGTITLNRNLFIDIHLRSDSFDRKVTISKNLLLRNIVNSDFNSLILGATSIDKIDFQKKEVVFLTFCGKPESDNGVLLCYSVNLKGAVTFLEMKEIKLGE